MINVARGDNEKEILDKVKSNNLKKLYYGYKNSPAGDRIQNVLNNLEEECPGSKEKLKVTNA